MKIFISPEGMSKEEFLVRHGTTGTPHMARQYLSDPCDCHLLVCWIACEPNNLIQFVPSPEEYHQINEKYRHSDLSWFVIEKNILAEYIPTGSIQ